MKRAERWSGILDMLGRSGGITVEDAAGELGVSLATVRRDLSDLHKQQLLRRTHGGATANGTAYDLPMRYRQAQHAADKTRIAEAAAAMVRRGMVVSLNGGTTTTEVARHIVSRPELEGPPPAVTVVTNAVNIANELTVRAGVKLVVTGGVARPQSYELIGPLAAATLTELSIDVAFLGVEALHPVEGAAAGHEGEASVNRLLAQRAERVVVVAHGAKLGARAFARICSVDQIHDLVTDRDAPAEVVAQLQEAGVRVTQA